MTVSGLPWQAAIWQRLMRRHRGGQLPHALLITGLAGVGKMVFARTLAQSLLCQQPDAEGQPCGQCQACRTFAAHVHPDLLLLEPEEEGKAIKVDAVRQFCAEIALTSQYGGYKVGVVAPADAMNENAANSLLKTLEEPPANTVIILVTSRPVALPITIRSRCQVVAVPRPPRVQALEWLNARDDLGAPAELLLDLAAGAPLAALELAQGGGLSKRKDWIDALMRLAARKAAPVAEAEGWLQEPLPPLLDWAQQWVVDLIRCRQTDAGKGPPLHNSDLRAGLLALAKSSNLKALYGLYDHLLEMKALSGHPLNQQLLLEDLFCRCQVITQGV